MHFPFPMTPEEAGRGFAVAFFSVMPGAGASTLACLTALALAEAENARNRNRGVALADLHPQGKARSYLGLTPDVCPASIVDAAAALTPEEIRMAGVEHPRGLFVLPGPIRPLDAYQVDTPLTLRVVTSLKRVFPLSVVISGPLHGAGWIAAMACDLVCLVASPDRTCLDVFRETVDLLHRLGCGGRFKVILNQSGAPGGLREGEINEALKPDAVIPYDPALRAANNKRYPSPGKYARTLVALVPSRQENSFLVKKE
ncbi:MAG: AAA family ATPase [Moorellaceae bacterium]